MRAEMITPKRPERHTWARFGFRWIFSLLLGTLPVHSAYAVESFCPTGSNPDAAIIWCDDFEDSTPFTSKYFEFDAHSGDFGRVNYESFAGQ